MGKLVVLKLGDGSFDQGFPVTLQIGEEGRCPCVEITGRLPSIPEIAQCYSGWAKTYRHLGLRSRLEASKAQLTNVSKIESCCHAAQLLRERLNAWLASEPFRPLRERLLEQLMPGEEIRIIVQTENIGLRRLPWHLWDLCDRYPKAEIALSAPVYELVEQISPPHTKVRILAILGNSTGINTQADRLLLEGLQDAEVSFLVEPQRQELTEEIWKQGWDILFFAGHSSSQENGETGRIYLNQTDSLTIEQLRFALRKAVERGLKIAIFNSCDGLGLARNLEDLQIPQIIVMREPVPDRVCQEFLKYFLAAFARGESFYLAVREARERLEGLEDDFPCATWLPMICQNLAVVPPTWKALGGGIANDTAGDTKGNYIPPVIVDPLPPAPPKPPKDIWKGRRGLAKVLCISLGITCLVMGVRHLGKLQPLELKAFDFMMQKRPAEPPDSRLLVVTITEEDIQAQKQDLRPGTSLSDRSLSRLLEKLESYQPRAIGLDIYRDFPVAPGYEDLAKRMQHSDRFFSVCKVSTEINDHGISPPPEVSLEHQGFSDVAIDPDKVLRRHLLYMTPGPASPCLARYALSTQLAFRYLATEKKKIVPQITSDGYIQLGTTIFKRLQARTGGYQNIDAWGHQVMLNYRSHNSIEDFVPQITLTQALNSPLDPEAVKDKIILIGVTAPSRKDYFFTPYSTKQQIPGVLAQAQMVSQILSTVLNGRPLFWVWPGWGEALWIWGWSLVGGLIFWRFQLLLRLGLVVGTLFILYSLCFGLLIQGGWVPLMPSALALILTGGSVVTDKTFQTYRKPKPKPPIFEPQSNQYLQP
ncbi:MAG TPA: sensor protein Chase2 [Cyanobacteria bacterium UBA8543]|nr:sensor protein Chase2 [Cyanobacteria bacterium UBA8543]